MNRKMFVNLAVKDLNKSVDFFKKLGFTFDKQFTDDTATMMVVSEDAYVMLLSEKRFKDFTKKAVVDSTKSTEAIVALSGESKQEVDQIVQKALANGGKPANDKMEQDGMYGWSFQDPDGHLWEVVWMDPKAMQPSAE